MRTQEKLYTKEQMRQKRIKKELEEEERIFKMTVDEKIAYDKEKIVGVNEDATDLKDKILDGLSDKDLGNTPQRDLGKARSLPPLRKKKVTREDLTSTKRYNKFRDEFKDIFESAYEHRNEVKHQSDVNTKL